MVMLHELPAHKSLAAIQSDESARFYALLAPMKLSCTRPLASGSILEVIICSYG